MTTMMDLQINDENSLKSFYSALSTLDEDTLVDTLIIADKTPLTRVNLVKHLINVSIFLFSGFKFIYSNKII
jgi:hypothetical protein